MTDKPQTPNTLPEKSSELVPQRHGGAISPGNPGNRGGSGRPPSVVRERARSAFYDRIPALEKLADNDRAEDRDRIRAIDTLGKYGLHTGRLDIEEVRTRLARTIAKVEELCEPTTASRLLAALDLIWNPNAANRANGTIEPSPGTPG